ncbi:DUF1738 domain-containing protein [Segetibacter sp. 3557_3]|uniref:ArdC family protein n=1 Tax=Segetibacter sp. 3557_3 TaxID=2547429 RepID=UPI001058A972|nr:zincin-like metallopeptidase domain-containing protein [Segetibacter sp. 3557_3]TDH17800.1 DUF1738 domain-containing protein [Segetibacter sp. 3557_3]
MNQAHKFHDVYQDVTNRVIEALQQGDIVWQKGWNALGLPQNLVSHKPYRGWNVFWLNFVTMVKGYKTPYYITFNQAQNLGGTIRKGEKGVRITYWATLQHQDNTRETEELATSDTEPTRTRMVPKVHTVFNYDQTEGLELPQIESMFRKDVNSIAACEDIISAMPSKPQVMNAGDQAYYQPAVDRITMPIRGLFLSDEAYYATFFHELAHSTGHSSRLNRPELMETDGFGGVNYSKEELTAELTASFLCAIAGIQHPTIQNAAAYIQGWLKALQNDKTLVFKAASHAQKAADYILNSTQD